MHSFMMMGLQNRIEMTEERAPYYAGNEYPSGPWRGFYTGPGLPGRCGMCFSLAFDRGRIHGDGWDEVGYFSVHGTVDAHGGCRWAKIYPGSHVVTYAGKRDGTGISGSWTLGPDLAGEFQMWPGDPGPWRSHVWKMKESVGTFPGAGS